MPEQHFDLVVIGTGSAGHGVALACRKRGWKVAIVDERPFGGTCALRGCDPKKVLVHAASVVASARQLQDRAVLDRAPLLQWRELQRFKRTFTDPVPAERNKIYADAGIAAIEGRAAFHDERTIAAGGELLRAEHIVIASGAATKHVAPGDELLIDSEGFLDLETLPSSLLFLGGGFIAFEFAYVARYAGADVTIVHKDDTPLEEFDRALVAHLVEHSRAIGIRIELDTEVERVSRESGAIAFHAKRQGKESVLRAEAGVLAAGRAPDLEPLQLERGNVKRGERGISVDAHLQSVSNPRVYAAGDAAEYGPPLTPVAGYGSEIVAANLLDGNTHTIDLRGLASMVYTIPPLGRAGLSEDDANKRGLAFDVNEGDMKTWYSTRLVAAETAYYKTLVEKQSGRILGATILGPHAEEQINVLALAIRAELTAQDVRGTLFAYPAGSSDLEHMLGS